MKNYGVYTANGQIDLVITCPPHLADLQGGPGIFVIELDDNQRAETHYVTDGQVVEKQPLNLPESLQITADGTDEAVISNIPAGITVQWPDGEIDEVTDGEVRFAVDLPGTYTLTFDAIPYLRQEVTIEAVAAT